MNYLKPFGSQNFVLGVGLAALTYLFGPSVKNGARNVAVKSTQGALMAGETATNAVYTGKEKVSDFFGNLMGGHDGDSNHIMEQQQVFSQFMHEIQEERKQSNELMKNMMKTMKDMQHEISTIKNNSSVKNSTVTPKNK